MKKRFKYASITPEQIVDGTTNCHISFFINVADRECIISVEEKIDGSALVTLSSIDDLLKIPEDFYELTGHQLTGANSCVFNSFIFNGTTIDILRGITLEDVVAQGLFEPLPDEEDATAGADDETTTGIESIDYSLLENPTALLEAFSQSGLQPAWFNMLSKHPWLNASKKIPGKPGRGGFPALFCPYQVMVGLVNESRKSKLTEQRGWNILEKKFPYAYARHEIGKPDFDQSD